MVMLRRDAFQLMKEEFVIRNAAGTANLVLGIVGRRGEVRRGRLMSQGRIPGGPREQSNPCFGPKSVEETNMGYGKLLIRVMDMSSKTITV